MTQSGLTLTFREVTPETWTDFETLFESRGAPHYCWCMAWRMPPAQRKEASKADLKAAMHGLIDSATPVGVLAYRHDTPIGWCSVAPRSQFHKGMAPIDPNESEVVWSIICFYVVRAMRGEGVVRQLIEVARAVGRNHGATVLEAYPVDPDSPSYGFGGRVPTFAKAGFEEVGRPGARRRVMRVKLN